MVSVLVYFTSIMSLSEETRDPSWFAGPANHVACRSLIMIGSVVLMYMECQQIRINGINYIFAVYNII
jgi:hypothetical protein